MSGYWRLNLTAVEVYECFDDFEGFYEVYVCRKCGNTIANSLDFEPLGKKLPQACQKCGASIKKEDQ